MNTSDSSISSSRILHRRLGIHYPTVTRGEGLWLYDDVGKAYLDACGGAAVSCLGHCHPDVLAAMHSQLNQLDYAHTSFFTSQPAEALAEELIAHAPAGMTHVYFAGSGSEAMETALKMARQYFVEIGQPQRRRVVAQRQSYHGNSLGALSVGGNAARRKAFQPLLFEVQHVAPCYAYRGLQPGETLVAYGERLATELEALVLQLGSTEVMAFVAETVGGATVGCIEPAPGYFKRVREICTQHGILLILDEVMCGMGRTGTLHACETEGVSPDLMTVAKGLGGGYASIGAVFLAAKIHDAFERGSRMFHHGHTYLGHPLACAAALAVQQVIRRDGLLNNVQQMGVLLRQRLLGRFGGHAQVGDVRGRGLLQAIELVADRDTRQPFESKLKLHDLIRREAMARSLLVYSMGGTVDGQQGDHILLAPPFNVDAASIDDIVDRLGAAVDAALATVISTTTPTNLIRNLR